ncbi:MAG: dihydrofolate reductase family protein, partial [Nostoc sp. DedQUE01]
MKTQYYTATSLDGFIADEENSLSWLLQFGELEDGSYSGFINQVGAIAMGSTTYEWILNHQINEQAEHQQGWVYEQPTWVFRDFQRINSSKKNKRQVFSRMIIILRGEKRGCPRQPLFSPHLCMKNL